MKALFSEISDRSTSLKSDQLGTVAGVVGTYWLYGQDAKMKWFFTPRNGLAQLRYLGAGGVSTLILLPSKFPRELQGISYDDATEKINNCDVSLMKKLIEAKCAFMVEQEQFDTLYIPTASILCEVILRTQVLIFGMRKPMIFHGMSHCASYTWLMEAYTKSETPCGKMSDALHLMMCPTLAAEEAEAAPDLVAFPPTPRAEAGPPTPRADAAAPGAEAAPGAQAASGAEASRTEAVAAPASLPAITDGIL